MRIFLQQPVMYKCQLHFRYFFFVFHVRQIIVDFFEVFLHLWTDVVQSGGDAGFILLLLVIWNVFSLARICGTVSAYG